MSKTRVFIPRGYPPGAFANQYLADCMGHACPTGYLAAGYLEMNQALREAHAKIDDLISEKEMPLPSPRYTAAYISARAINARLNAQRNRHANRINLR